MFTMAVNLKQFFLVKEILLCILSNIIFGSIDVRDLLETYFLPFPIKKTKNDGSYPVAEKYGPTVQCNHP